jgi:hypothetical protein
MALVFISFSFLPIYNLFRFGQVGAISNVREVEATNHASDLINFLRELGYTQLRSMVSGKNELSLEDDEKIKSYFPNWKLKIDPKYSRSLALKRYAGNNHGLQAIIDYFKMRKSVPNYLAEVKVSFKKATGVGLDDVVLHIIVTD